MNLERRGVGRHVPIAAGMVPALRAVREAGYDAVQVFPGNPKGWHYTPLGPDASAVRAAAVEFDLAPLVIHAPYIINLAAPEGDLAANSGQALASALARAREIGAAHVVVHAGSPKSAGEDVGIARVARLVESVLSGVYPSPWGSAIPDAGLVPRILVENSVGAGGVLAGSPEALGRLVAALPHEVGVCIDTAHLWGGGSDLATPDGVEETLARLEEAVGLARIGVLHLNDSAAPLGSHRDVHARLGAGTIGLPGLAAWAAHPALRTHHIIMETPLEDCPAREAARCAMARLLLAGDIEAATQALLLLETSGDALPDTSPSPLE